MSENPNDSPSVLVHHVVEAHSRRTPEAGPHETFEEAVARQNRQGVRYEKPTLTAAQFESMALTQTGFDRKAVGDYDQIIDAWTLARVRLVATLLGNGAIWILLGPQGTGKSTAGALMGRLAFRARRDVLCVHWPILVRKVISTYSRASDVTAEEVLVRPYEVQFLVVEDLQGTEAKPHELNMLVAMVRRRFDNGKDTVFCTEATMESTEQILGSAIVARANQCGGFIHFTGPTKRT